MNCSSKNILYVIKCNGCGEDYIGQTSNELRKRMTVHMQQIRNPHVRMIPLSNHLHNCSKNKTKPFSVFPFYKFQEDANEIQKNWIRS